MLNGLDIFRQYFNNPDDCMAAVGGWCELHTYTLPLLEKVISPEDKMIVMDIGWYINEGKWTLEEWN